MRPERDPDVFLAAPPKTGGTYITRILSQHPDLAFARESYILKPGLDDSVATPGSRKLEWHGLTDDDARRWFDAITQEGLPGARRAIRELMGHMREVTGAKLVGDSWPFWAINAKAARAMFPDAFWIYVVRDPRAVVASPDEGNRGDRTGMERLYNMLGADQTIRDTVPPEQVFIVQYEAAVREHKRVMKAAWEWLGLDPDKGWWSYSRKRDPLPLRWSHIKNATKRPDPERCTAWRKVLPKDEIREATRLSQEYCRRYRYPTDVAGPLPGDALARFLEGKPAAHVGEQFIREEIVRMKRIIHEAVSGCDRLSTMLQDDIGDGLGEVHGSEWRRGYVCGDAQGRIRGSTSLLQLRNRLLMIMMGDHEGVDDEQISAAPQEHGGNADAARVPEHQQEPTAGA